MATDEHKTKLAALFLGLAFVAINSLLVTKNIMSFSLLPVILLLVLGVVLVPVKIFYLVIALAPLSVPLSEFLPGRSFDLWLPTEPLIFALLLLTAIHLIQERRFDTSLFGNPLFWAMLFYLGWLVITCISSELPLVSVKYTVLRIGYIAFFFYIPFVLFKATPQNFTKYIAFYITGLTVVVAITLYRQARIGIFDKFAAVGTCNPFYTDHTSYGAALAFLIPVVVAWAASTKTLWQKILMGILILVFTVALVLSYSRAAWLSLLVAVLIWVVWLMKLRFRTIAILSVSFVAIGFGLRGQLAQWVGKNQTVSTGSLSDQLLSVGNITTDVSNVERLNRWTSALRMFRERPFLGWGPGTYQFTYAPFQPSQFFTVESSNLGAKGNAHSEYLGLLAEAGWPATMGYIAILLVAFIMGFRLLGKLPLDFPYRKLLLGVLLGLSTYAFHGFLNNFLDMDKIAALFWGYLAMIAAMNTAYRTSSS